MGERMAGAKNLRKMNPLTAVYRTSGSSVDRDGCPEALGKGSLGSAKSLV